MLLRTNYSTLLIVIVTGSSTIAYVECYDTDYNEWYDAFPMNLSRSALSACVIAGLANAREYSYLGKARDLGQGERNIWTRLPFVANAPQRRWLKFRLWPLPRLPPHLTQRLYTYLQCSREFDGLALCNRPFLRESLYFRCEDIIAWDSRKFLY